MNKNMMILAGLLLCSAHTALPMGAEQREILYILNEMGQDFASVPMITQNIDMFVGIMEMNVRLIEKRLGIATSKAKKSLLKNAALVGAVMTHRIIIKTGLDALPYELRNVVSDTTYIISYGITATIYAYAALNIHDTQKNKSALSESLALDKEILAKLHELKESLDQNTELAENNLLESATQS